MEATAKPAGFYTVSVEAGFSALHRLRLADGRTEPMHGHDWRVTACFAQPRLDGAGMVIDFQEAQDVLRSVVAGLHHTDLNSNPAWSGMNPTAEAVARWIFDGITARGFSGLRAVRVTEAPGCVATFEAFPEAWR